jgi:hypothetical protein
VKHLSLINKKIFLSFIITIATAAVSFIRAQEVHPHILVKPQDKQTILVKIEKQPWAKSVFDNMARSVQPYVDKHTTDPEWILSRYLMNRVPGKRYTKFYSDKDGTALIGYGGDAPVPTVRVSPHKRSPITKDGYSYKMPALEELVPYDTSMKIFLQSNAPGGKKEWTDPGTFVEGINGKINELALNAAIIYWLTGKEEYARFAADILSQWVRGAYYQNPIEGPCRTGFLSIQTLGDGHYEPMPLIYDFLYNFLREKKYETKWYETVFEKIASTMTFRGYWNNNWFAAQSPAMVFAALSLEDKQRRDYYLNFYFNKDTINGSCGHLALPSVVSKWLTPDGHWKEPGGYHNFPISSLLISALALENNGFNVFGKFPALLQSSYVLLKYSFPNFMAPSIGDTGPVSQSPECLELGMLMAKKYNNPIASQLTAAMEVMIEKKGYKREAADYLGLLCYLPEFPSTNTTYTWPRSGELDFAKCYLQRNGSDRENGLMYLVQGASYNHNHANGMSLELYGAGRVMGIDPGKGITYEAPMHVNYYAQWAAHNTVVAGGLSSSVPYFKGGGGEKKMGAITLAAMEPMADKEALSPYCSFTDTRYTDISTNTKQQRTLAIIRTSPTSGYYVDIYRSAHVKSNEYIYHNIGNDLQLLDEKRNLLELKPAEFPISEKPFDPPGFRLIKDFKTAENTSQNLVALFSLKEAGDDKYMQVLFAGEKDRVFYSGKGPQSNTADIPYRSMPTPTLISRQQGEAWKRPFIAVYEPFNGEKNYAVEKIENIDRSDAGNFTALEVFLKDGSRQIILQSINADKIHEQKDWKFKGGFAVINIKENKASYLYLGEGSQLSYQDYTVKTSTLNGSANLLIEENKLRVSCNQQTTININDPSIKKLTLVEKGVRKNLPFRKIGLEISFTIPAITNAEIQIN